MSEEQGVLTARSEPFGRSWPGRTSLRPDRRGHARRCLRASWRGALPRQMVCSGCSGGSSRKPLFCLLGSSLEMSTPKARVPFPYQEHWATRQCVSRSGQRSTSGERSRLLSGPFKMNVEGRSYLLGVLFTAGPIRFQQRVDTFPAFQS